MEDQPDLAKSSLVNQDMPRLVGEISGHRSLNFTYDEAQRVEGILNNCLESQNLAFWGMHTLLNWIKAEGFEPSDPALFEETISIQTMAMVRTTNLASSLGT